MTEYIGNMMYIYAFLLLGAILTIRKRVKEKQKRRRYDKTGITNRQHYILNRTEKRYILVSSLVSTGETEWGEGMAELINLMEETVLRKIDQLWPGTNYCKCEQCRLDIATYALNRLPAQYVQSMKGKVLYRFESNSMQRDIEVTVAVGQGLRS